VPRIWKFGFRYRPKKFSHGCFLQYLWHVVTYVCKYFTIQGYRKRIFEECLSNRPHQ